MIKGFNAICYLILITVLVIVYFACFHFSYEGYGYPGYHGYHHHHHSHWYFYRHDYAYDTSVRENLCPVYFADNRCYFRGLE